jgi:hypothetical protein
VRLSHRLALLAATALIKELGMDQSQFFLPLDMEMDMALLCFQCITG